MSFPRPVFLALCAVACCRIGWAAEDRAGDELRTEDLGIAVPEGFEVSLYADDALAHDIYSMTIDPRGHVVVSGPGYVKILEDTDGDGRADKATLFSSRPAGGAHGMVFDGNDLICTGDDSLMRLHDRDGDGVADGPPEIWANLRNPEHGANGLVKGPDGWIYLICGNDAGVTEKIVTLAGSPVKQPRCGAVARFSPDGKQSEVIAHGFRNPYDFDFNAAGQLFTVDSDGERDYHLPWYAPTRLFDIALGCEHGWLLQGWTRSWNRPASFLDSGQRLVEIGRGSPTGVVVYRHRQFPEHYRGGVFSACWTLGRVYYFALEPQEGTYHSRKEIFLRTTGHVGFAPCDLAVGPEGDLFVAIGGRRTQGSVFRIRHTGQLEPQNSGEPLQRVLDADQPLSSWSRAEWIPLARQLGPEAFAAAVIDKRLTVPLRVRAIEVLTELFDGIPRGLAEKAVQLPEPELRARIAWAVARRPDGAATLQVLNRLTGDDDPRVARAAWEGLMTLESIDPAVSPPPQWSKSLDGPSPRRVRMAAIVTARGAGAKSYHKYREGVLGIAPFTTAQCLAHLWIKAAIEGTDEAAFSAEAIPACLDCYFAAPDAALQLEAVRLLQISLGDLRVQPGEAEVFSGYLGNATAKVDPALRQKIVDRLLPAFPSADAELNRELARLLGIVGADRRDFVDALARQWTAESAPEDDIHYLIVAALSTGDRSQEVTDATARALVHLRAKLRAHRQRPSQNWPLRVGEVFAALCQRDWQLPDALLADPDFGRPDHALFAEKLSTIDQQRAVQLLLAKAQKKGRATSELIKLLEVLPPEEWQRFVRSQWRNAALRDAIALLLAQHPQAVDREKFVQSLASPQPHVVARSAEALAQLSPPGTAAEIGAALQALRQASIPPANKDGCERLGKLLAHWVGKDLKDLIAAPADQPAPSAADDPQRVCALWFAWFKAHYPREAAALGGMAGDDLDAWSKRLAQVDWDRGEATRGRAVFERRACHRCHQASGQLGPDLNGIASRLSREDLFTAILDPSREVSPTYQTVQITTRSGQSYHGILVYESPEGTLLQTGPDTTVRIAGKDRLSMRTSRLSLMPTGLLNNVTDDELADLYAYLKTLGRK